MSINPHRNSRKITHEHLVFSLTVIFAAMIYAGRLWRIINLTTALLFIANIVCLVILSASWRAWHQKRKRVKTKRKPALPTADTMDGVAFERVIANLLKNRGFHHIKLTERYDLGIDIIAERGKVRWGIQVKRHKQLIGMAAVSQVVAALAHYNCDRAMVITNGRFSASARMLAASNNCLLIDGSHLRHWARLRHSAAHQT